jgi:hypothetical protein
MLAVAPVGADGTERRKSGNVVCAAARPCTIVRSHLPGSSTADAASSRIKRKRTTTGLAGRDDGWAGRRMADRLDAMSIGIQHKRAVVIGVIVQPESRRTIVAAPCVYRKPYPG